jgi:hypothetical protein
VRHAASRGWVHGRADDSIGTKREMFWKSPRDTVHHDG